MDHPPPPPIIFCTLGGCQVHPFGWGGLHMVKQKFIHRLPGRSWGKRPPVQIGHSQDNSKVGLKMWKGLEWDYGVILSGSVAGLKFLMSSTSECRRNITAGSGECIKNVQVLLDSLEAAWYTQEPIFWAVSIQLIKKCCFMDLIAQDRDVWQALVNVVP